MIQFDPGSFKDPSGSVFFHDRWVCRTLSEQARSDFQSAAAKGLIAKLVDEGLLIESEIVSARDLSLRAADVGDFVLKHPRLSFVSYSYEWSFEMLRDAARTTLLVMDRALAAGFILKDANAFNILFAGNAPLLVDVPSLEPYHEGEIWAGYAQFCRSFLFPLLLSSYRGLDTQGLLRASLGELSADETARLLSGRDYLRRGVLKHVVFQARLERSFAESSTTVKSIATAQAYPKSLLVANVRGLIRLIESLKAPSPSSVWSVYDKTHTYTEADVQTKQTFVQTVLRTGSFSRVVDLGCNIGDYSLLALQSGSSVIALDLDSAAIDRLYRRLTRRTALSPVVGSLLNPSPAMGWALKERRSLLERVRSDAFLALALIHHLRITGGIPLAAIVNLLFEIAPEGIIEWVDKRDAMVTSMLNLRPDVYTDYSWSSFRALVDKVAEFVSIQDTHGGLRRLCHVRLRPSLRIDAELPQL
jgi:hypothetical protein